MAAEPDKIIEQRVPTLPNARVAARRTSGAMAWSMDCSAIAALDGVLAKDDVLLCVDGDAAVIAYAKKRGIEFETIIASKGEHVHEKVLHLRNVNATVSRFKNWLTRFNGVASKYLPNYLAWRRRLETGEIPFVATPC